MASQVDWKGMIDDAGSTGRGKKSQDNIYLRIESGKQYQVRPVGGAVAFAKFFLKTKDGPKSAIVDLKDRDKLAVAVSAKLGSKQWGSKRFAMNVIDREDGKVKILEGGTQIFENFAAWSKANKDAAPGAKTALDWNIIARGDGLDKKYTVTGFERTTLTDEEVKHVKDTIHDLNKFYKGVSMEEAMKILFGADTEIPEQTLSAAADEPVDSTPVDALGF